MSTSTTLSSFHRSAVDETRSQESSRLLTEASHAPPSRRERLLDRVVNLNLAAADRAAHRYRSRGVPYDDLVQVARLGLVKAADRYDPARGSPFLSFAYPTMLGELRRYFRDNAWTIRPPRRIQELQAEVVACSEDWAQRYGRSATVEELAVATGHATPEVSEALASSGCFQPSSLDVATLAHRHVGVSEGGYQAAEDVATLAAAMDVLSARDRRIIWLRFYEDRAQVEIAQELGVTQMQVSRLLRRILEQMRRHLAAA